ncbi:olfactory receptor 52K1-like [Hyla sarda]|uniref:olfactory receptor 52K1-like n=1 Tax=Hyla sarda TaxID=327740 RepID=UPI0024C34C89|nr:olfactory receptor 52K1-like [Hyla sarda]
MADWSNQSLIRFTHTEFVLFGFPGIITHRKLLTLPFVFVYILILTGNFTIVYRIFMEKSLQAPMYFFISILFLANISCTTSITPKFLLGLSLGLDRISRAGCLAQMFSIYSMTIFESGVMLAMALDRYVAICRPLRYNDIMTTRTLVVLTCACWARSVCLVSPVVIMTFSAQYCRSNIILNFVCENMGLLSLACGDISRQKLVGLVVRSFITLGDFSLLVLSYSTILNTAMKIATGKTRNKALNTCGTHLLVAMFIYMCTIISSIIYRMHRSISIDILNLVSAMYLMLPATVNPVIYGFKIKEIRKCLTKSWRKKNHLTRT